MTYKNFLVDQFKNVQVAVVGDCMLDTWLTGSVNRISPEAPVPIMQLEATTHMLGGAANVARNITHLGGSVKLFGVCGTDASAHTLSDLIAQESGIQNHMIVSAHRKTTHKTRVQAHNQQIVRLDQEHTHELTHTEVDDFLEQLTLNLSDCACVIMSDYAKGVICEPIMRAVMSWAHAHDVKVLVDPKRSDWRMYAHADVITPNWREYCAVTQSDHLHVVQARQLCVDYKIENVLITQAERGMSLISLRDHAHVHSKVQEVADVSGAGDTVIAVMALALSVGCTPVQAMTWANLAAGISVSKRGTATVTPQELITAIQG